MKTSTLNIVVMLALVNLTGCATTMYTYNAKSNVPATEVYCGYRLDALRPCYITPYYQSTPNGKGWGGQWFQGKKEGYLDTKIVKANITATTGSLRFYMEPDNSAEISKQKARDGEKVMIASLVAKNDFQGLKEYTDKNPNSVYYITDQKLRLALTGQKGMKVGDIRKLIKNGRSETIIIALIKRVKSPYKEFTLDEIDNLTSMGLSDNIVAAMIDVTTELLKDEKRNQQQEYFLAEQKRASTKTVTTSSYNQGSKSNPLANKVEDELVKQGVGKLMDSLF